jgi:hypothetical protein
MMARAKQQQQDLPGPEFKRESIPEIEEAAENYRALRDERMALSEREANAKKDLISQMTTRSVTVFRYDDSEGVERRVTLETKTNAKVGKVKSQSAAADSDVEVS